MTEIHDMYHRLKQLSQDVDKVYKDFYKDVSAEAIKEIVENSEMLLKVKLADHVINSLKEKKWFHPLRDTHEDVIDCAIYTFDIILESHYEQVQGERTYNAGWKDALKYFNNQQHRREEELAAEIANIKSMTVLEFANWLAEDQN